MAVVFGMKRDSSGATKQASLTDMFQIPAKSNGVWKEEGSGLLLVYTPEDCEPRPKVAAFDMDGTLITTKSGKVFAVNHDDWKLLYDSVKKTLKEFHKIGYKLVIFTNQKGIATGQVDAKGLKTKIGRIIATLNLPIQAFVSTGDGKYRKPCTGMWTALQENNGDVKIDMGESIYVGDAAGRHKTKSRPKKDHACADRFFASNVGLRFETPEQFFLGQKAVEPWGPPAFEPKNLFSPELTLLSPSDAPLPAEGPEIIVLVGFPGSGKSTFAKKLQNEYGYGCVNRDTLGTWQKCVATARALLKDGKSVVVDNTNPDLESRSRYISLANELGIPCRCFSMNCGMAQAQHNVKFRSLTQKKDKEVGTMVLRMFNSKFKQPEVSEGFSSVVMVNFIPEFESAEDKAVFQQHLVE